MAAISRPAARNASGKRLTGPAPRDLDRYRVSKTNGTVVVDTSAYVCGFPPPGAACAP